MNDFGNAHWFGTVTGRLYASDHRNAMIKVNVICTSREADRDELPHHARRTYRVEYTVSINDLVWWRDPRF